MKLFIYGTLKTNHRRNFYLAGKEYANATFVGQARTAPKYRLLKSWLVDYPCLVDSPRGLAVEGELWDCPDERVGLIDMIEGGQFIRKTIILETDDDAQAYFIRDRPWLLYWDVGKKW